MNTFITLSCLLAVAASAYGSGIGYGGYGPLYGSPIIKEVIKEVPVIKEVVKPIIKEVVKPIIKEIPVIKPVLINKYDNYGIGLGYGKGLGYGYGLGYGLGYGGYGYKGLGYGVPYGGYGYEKVIG